MLYLFFLFFFLIFFKKIFLMERSVHFIHYLKIMSPGLELGGRGLFKVELNKFEMINRHDF